jgi:anthranilate phosphoribosyltransferase
MPLFPYLERVADRRDLTAAEAQSAMEMILGGTAGEAQIAAFLTALRMKGETAEELVGFARAMRAKVTPVNVLTNVGPLLDTCGTGGDCAGTFNVSTLAAFVVAGAGVRVAKHGNRSISSQCGSADLLEAMGIDIALSPDDTARAIAEVGIGFLFAPALQPAMRHAQPVRRELRLRTVFNLLGPLTNPANATAQVVGTPSTHSAELVARALASLGLERGFVVHGSDGLDEITTTGPTTVFAIEAGKVERRTVEPADFAVRTAAPGELKGGDVARNHAIARAVLDGERGAARDIVLVNAAAGLVAAGRVTTFLEGAAVAAVSIDTGAARRKAEELARFRPSRSAA